ncbi:hypothetical protein C8R44DRAFT_747577 [Mycena epipterygia]|nr:hypothetical protein C8R44DRAFT_747577 [Mycena epipterygia]
MAALRSISAIQGMMAGSSASYAAIVIRGEAPQPPGAVDNDNKDDDNDAVPGPKSLAAIEFAHIKERGYPRLEALTAHIQQRQLPELLRRFLYEQLHPDSDIPASDVPLNDCPRFDSRISVYHSATARFYAPSDLCGAGGMHRERIRSNPRWHGAYPRRDTVLLDINSELRGMLRMIIGRVFLFFSFTHHGNDYTCALVQWFPRHGNAPDDDTGLWVVTPEFHGNGQKCLAVVPLNYIARGAHLLPVDGSSLLPEDFHFSYSLDVFRAFFVNRYADHHIHEFLMS